MTGPKFSPYPWHELRRLTRADAAFESACARFLGASPLTGTALRTLVGGAVEVALVGVVGGGALTQEPAPPPTLATTVRAVAAPIDATAPAAPRARGRSSKSPDATLVSIDAAGATLISGDAIATDANAAFADVRIGGISALVTGGGGGVRALAQNILGGPPELPAPRPLTPAEHAIFALAIAAALEDAGVAGEVVPRAYPGTVSLTGLRAIEFAVRLGDVAKLAAIVFVPEAVALRVPGKVGAWIDRVALALPIVVGRCALPRAAIATLQVRDAVTIDRTCELVIGGGSIALAAAPGAIEGRVASGYRARMGLPDDAHVELTLSLGTTQLTVRQLVELAVGQIVPFGRPLAGPFELRVEGRVIGAGELVDVEGELGVRIVRLG